MQARAVVASQQFKNIRSNDSRILFRDGRDDRDGTLCTAMIVATVAFSLDFSPGTRKTPFWSDRHFQVL